MSRAAKVIFSATLLLSSLTIWAVHFQQSREREVRFPSFPIVTSALTFIQIMYKGVLRDDERRRQKMEQRKADLEKSLRKHELYERVQPIAKTQTEDP
jgi:protein PET117